MQKLIQEIITNFIAICWSFLIARHHSKYSMYTIIFNAVATPVNVNGRFTFYSKSCHFTIWKSLCAAIISQFYLIDENKWNPSWTNSHWLVIYSNSIDFGSQSGAKISQFLLTVYYSQSYANDSYSSHTDIKFKTTVIITVKCF